MKKNLLFVPFVVQSLCFSLFASAPPLSVTAGNSEGIYGSIVFSEILANNLSSQQEFVELYNRSETTLQLEGWKFYYGDKPYNLPQVSVAPGEYLVLCKTTAVSSFPLNLKVIGVSSFPTLANTGKLLYLENRDGALVSLLEYSDKMYDDAVKKNGGWSLECLDVENLGSFASNWTSSVDPSGITPGKHNSVATSNPDKELPSVLSVTMSDNNVVLTFSKPMNQATLLNKKSYLVDNQDYSVVSLQTDYPKGTELVITFNQLPPQGEIFELILNGVRDLSGFSLGDDSKMIPVGSGEDADSLDVVINELLFNAPTGGEEYIELYNRSDKAIDVRYLSVATRKTDGSMNTSYVLASNPEFLTPGEYIVVTKSADLICAFYDCQESSRFAQLTVTPALNNTSGSLVLLNNQTGKIVDEFAYIEKMHDAGIKDKKGVSLERVNADLATSSPDNWKSASADSKYGTPGYINSQHTGGNTSGIADMVSVMYPDGLLGADTYKVHYRFSNPGNRCRVILYDSMGRLVEQIANNEILGTEGFLDWSGGKLNAGIYIVYMEVYDLNGNVKKYKLPVVLK